MTQRAPRNHARRVEYLQQLHARRVLRYVEARRPDPKKPWVYVIEAAGEQREVPTGQIETFIDAFHLALAAAAQDPDRTGTGNRDTQGAGTAPSNGGIHVPHQGTADHP